MTEHINLTLSETFNEVKALMKDLSRKEIETFVKNAFYVDSATAKKIASDFIKRQKRKNPRIFEIGPLKIKVNDFYCATCALGLTVSSDVQRLKCVKCKKEMIIK